MDVPAAQLASPSFNYGDATYTGRHIERLPCGRIKMDQSEFAASLTVAPMTHERACQLDSDLTKTELTDFKSGTGCLQWLVYSRPDLLRRPSPRFRRPRSRTGSL